MAKHPLPDELFTLPERITIPSPRHVVVPRGIYATQPLTYPRMTRWRDDHWELVKEASKVLGMGITEFIRWNTLMVARETLHRFAVAQGTKPSSVLQAIEPDLQVAPDTEVNFVTTKEDYKPPEIPTKVRDPSEIQVIKPNIKKIIL